MARETKEERKAREAAERATQEKETAEFRKGMPERLMLMQALAQQIGVNTTVTLTSSGPEVHFHNDGSGDLVFDDRVGYNTDQWEVEYVERRLNELKAEVDARTRRRGIAEDVWKNKLTAEEKAALKENIYHLY